MNRDIYVNDSSNDYYDDFLMSGSEMNSSVLDDENDEQYDDSFYYHKEIQTIDSIEYDSVSKESLDILEKDKRKRKKQKKNKTIDITKVNPDNVVRKTQGDIDREIVNSFYKNPTSERFSMIWKRFYYGVHSHACKIMGDWNRAEDMVQETFQRAWQKRFSFDPKKGNYSTWIYRICFNICATNLKQAEKKHVIVDMDINDLFDNTTYTDSIDNALNDDVYLTTDTDGKIVHNSFEEIQKKIYDTSLSEMQLMDSTFCQIMMLKDVKNMTLSEIAKQMNMKESKVKNIYYTNRLVLGERIKEKYSDLYHTYFDAKHEHDDEMRSVYAKVKNDINTDNIDSYIMSL